MRSAASVPSSWLATALLGVLVPAVVYISVVGSLGPSQSPAVEATVDRDIVAVLITASFCPASQRDEVRDGWPSVLSFLQEHATREDRSVRTLGIAIDMDAATGVATLSRYGEFDEISVGGNWANLGARRYIWETFPGRAAVPQILVIRRSIRHHEGGVEVLEESVDHRLVGISEIVRWIQAGSSAELDSGAK